MIALFSALALVGALAPPNSLASEPGFHHELKLNRGVYELSLDLGYSPGISLERVKADLKDGRLLNRLGAAVENIELEDVRNNQYKAVTIVKSFGFRTKMLSRCRETESSGLWLRECELDVTKHDGSKYMVWKKDNMRCEETAGQVRCRARIAGEVKPFTLLGFELMSNEKFARRVKAQAIENFKKLWAFTESQGAVK